MKTALPRSKLIMDLSCDLYAFFSVPFSLDLKSSFKNKTKQNKNKNNEW